LHARGKFVAASERAMILTNGQVVFADGIHAGLELTISDGKIADIGTPGRRVEVRSVDRGGNYIAPGVIDLHIHGRVARHDWKARRRRSH
jgi:predicted amidohydrolase